MTKLIEAKDAVVQFLKDNIKGEYIQVIKLEKDNQNWKAIAEVFEDDSFLKAMGFPVKKTRNFFSVKLDETLDVLAYGRVDPSKVYDEEESD